MNRSRMLSIVSLLWVGVSAVGAHAQGTLNPGGAPGPSMKSLQDLWDRMDGLESRVDGLVSGQAQAESLLIDYVRATGISVSNVWRIVTVDDDTNPAYFSVAYDAAGRPGIAYVDAGDSGLWFAKRDDEGAWRRELVYSVFGEYVMMFTALDFIDGVRPVIAFGCDTPSSSDLKYAEWRDGVWTFDVVQTNFSDNEQQCSIAVDPDGNPAVAYADEQRFRFMFARRDGTNWLYSVVSTNHTGFYNDLAFTPDGRPAVSCTGQSGGVLYAEHDGDAWQLTLIDTNVQLSIYTSLAFSPAGEPAVSYRDEVTNVAKVARRSGGNWITGTLEKGGDNGRFSSLAYLPSGRVAISYEDAVNHDVKYAEDDGSAFVITVIDGPGTVGLFASMAVSPSGMPGIAYRAEPGVLRFAEVVGRLLSP